MILDGFLSHSSGIQWAGDRIMSEEKADLLCSDCGEALSAFLQEMADHNAKITACPKCGKHHEFKPPKTAKPTRRTRVNAKTLLVTRPN
jgi:predicted RNA-binding Zn-ribbon protein involved in translation (DUF1610 family)